MSDITVADTGASQGLPQVKPAVSEAAKGFEDIMQEAIGKITQVQSDADKAVKEFASGGDPIQAIIAMEKANMNFQLMVEVRNKLISAYEEVMRMQV